MQNYHDGAIKVARQTQHFIRTMSPPADLLQPPFFCYKLATNRLICCPISEKMVLSVVSACLIVDYLYPNFLWKPFAFYLSLSVSFISTSIAQPYCMVYTSLSFVCPINENNQRRTCNMYLHIHLDLNLAAF